jgi:ABC-type transporter Mla MlaB component
VLTVHGPPFPATFSQNAIVVSLGGSAAQVEVPHLCDFLRVQLEHSDADLVICDVAALSGADACTVDAIARLQLTARRQGRHLRLRGASSELRELLRLMGMGGLVPCCGDLGGEVLGQAEEREEPGGVQEEGDAADPVA